MPVRTTVDIPTALHDRLRRRAENAGTSIRSLIVKALEQAYMDNHKKHHVEGPLVRGTGKLGPRFPKNENPHDIVLS